MICIGRRGTPCEAFRRIGAHEERPPRRAASTGSPSPPELGGRGWHGATMLIPHEGIHIAVIIARLDQSIRRVN